MNNDIMNLMNRRCSCRNFTEQEIADPLSFWNGYYYANTEGMMTREEHTEFLEKQKMPFLK